MAEMPRSEDLFLMLKRISWTLTAQLELRLKERNMRGTQVYFLVYLLRRHPQGTYLTESCRGKSVCQNQPFPLSLSGCGERLPLLSGKPVGRSQKAGLSHRKAPGRAEGALEKAGRMERKLDTALNQRERLQLWRLGRKLLEHLEQPDRSEYETDRRMLEREEHMNQLKQYKGNTLRCIGFTALEVVMEILMPFVTAIIIDRGLEVSNLSVVYATGR